MATGVMVYLLTCLQEVSVITVFLTIFLCGLLYQLCFRAGDRYSNPLPPVTGIRLPVIGHMYRLKPDMRAPLRELRSRYGDVYRMYFGSRLVIVVCGFKNIKEMFLKKGDEYADRPYLPLINRILRDSGFTCLNGDSWKQHRRFTLSTLRDLGMGKSALDNKLTEEAGRITDMFQQMADAGRTFNPKLIISTSVSNMICSLVFGQSFNNGDPKFKAMRAGFEENLRHGGGVVNFIPFLMRLPGDLFKAKKVLQNTDEIIEFIYDVIKEHQERPNPDKDDFVNAYITEMKRQQEEDGQSVFSLKDLASVFLDLFAAGTETTSTTLQWAILCLIIYPDLQERMFTEISDQVGTDRQPSVTDRLNLPFVEAFIYETIRYCQIGFVGLSHAANQDTVFNGFTIPKSAIIFTDGDSIVRDAAIWGDPDNFRPDRFLDNAGKLAKIEENIPFFLGKRSCPGESLARMEMVIFLSSVVQRFKLEPTDGYEWSYEGMDGQFGIVHSPKEFQIKAVPRDNK